MSLTHIDHIAIETSDVDRSVKWYRKKFRCEVKYQDQSWALISFNNVSLALVTPGQHPPHFAVVDRSVKENKSSKVHRDGIHYMYEQDPDKNFIETIHRKS